MIRARVAIAALVVRNRCSKNDTLVRERLTPLGELRLKKKKNIVYSSVVAFGCK